MKTIQPCRFGLTVVTVDTQDLQWDTHSEEFFISLEMNNETLFIVLPAFNCCTHTYCCGLVEIWWHHRLHL